MGPLVTTQTGGLTTRKQKWKKSEQNQLKLVMAFFSRILLYCRSILFHLPCCRAANEWQMRGKEAATLLVGPKFKCTECAVHVSSVKLQRLLF